MRIENSVAVVTGGGSGIGRGLAESFAAAGSAVVVGDIDGAAAEVTAQRIRDSAGRAVATRADATVGDDIRSLITLADNTFGPVDIFIANAGIVGAPGLGDESDWDRIIEVNLRAHIRAATVLMPDWQARGGGHFVSVASAAGLLSQIGAAGYAVTKHAAVGFAEWLAITYGDDGIGVSCVCPMGVNTALLDSLGESADAMSRLAASSIVNAGAVIEPRAVADLTVEAVRDGRFLVLPHPEVATMHRQKAADYDRWIAGMRRYRSSL